MLHSETCVNNLDNKVINVDWDALGDLYITAICIFCALGNSIVADTASMPSVANLYVY